MYRHARRVAHACDSGVFVSTEGRAGARAEGGNIINVETSKALASDAGTVGAVFERIGRSAGPVSAALDAGAARIAAGDPVA